VRYLLFGHEGKRNMLVICTETGHWCHHKSVLQLDVSQLQGPEKVGRHADNVRGFEGCITISYSLWRALETIEKCSV
jgi:hypothetical protein